MIARLFQKNQLHPEEERLFRASILSSEFVWSNFNEKPFEGLNRHLKYFHQYEQKLLTVDKGTYTMIRYWKLSVAS